MAKNLYLRAKLADAYKYSMNHMQELKEDKVCGCFYCKRIFSPSEITDWITDDEDYRGTACCPYCDIDAVIGESSGYPITIEFLKAMSDYYFG